MICDRYNENGHIRRNCPKQGGDSDDDTTGKAKGEVGIVCDHTSDDSHGDALITCDLGTKIHESWILNIGLFLSY